MKWVGIFVFSFWISTVSISKELFHLTPQENQEVEKRISDFYRMPIIPSAMDRQGLKINIKTLEAIEPHPELKSSEISDGSALLMQAQIKSTHRYQKWYCEKVLKKVIPKFPCEGLRTWADVGKDDRLADLVKTWVAEPRYELDQIPVSGKSNRPLWSDDFWAMERGLTSYRYSQGEWFSSYPEAIAAYTQPRDWLALLKFSRPQINQTVLSWSPSEKYDLSVGDQTFQMTLEQKSEGEWYQTHEGEVESWMGLCHGWAPAAIMVPRPEKPVQVVGPEGTEVLWYPNDIKALITLAWANGDWESNFVGRRCELAKPKLYPNGRIQSLDCFDNNPATFHLALGNLIGRAGASFVMDKAYDYQVWNQPVVAYSFEYFNPLKPTQKSKTWKKVAVPYDSQFKKKDRFQKPLTRGKFLEGPRERERLLRTAQPDGHIRKIVGVRATVVYLVETTPPTFGPEAGDDVLARDTLLYDLEIAQLGGQWVVTGGEWHQNNHPDFLFVPQRQTGASSYWDLYPFSIETAARASARSGYPLCRVVKTLVEQSQSGNGTYPCPE